MSTIYDALLNQLCFKGSYSSVRQLGKKLKKQNPGQPVIWPLPSGRRSHLLAPWGMVEARAKRQERLFMEWRRQNPMVAKNIGQLLGVILIPGAAGDFFSCLFDNRLVQKKKDNGAGLILEGIVEFLESRPQDLIQGPGILSQKSSETGEGSGEEGSHQGLDHGGFVPFCFQLDEDCNKRRKKFEKGARKSPLELG